MKKYILIILVFLPLNVLAADGETTGYFGALWDFIDWVYEVMDDIKQSIYDFLVQLGNIVFLMYLELKLATLVFVWDIAKAVLESLNLSDLISSLFSALPVDIQAFITELRIGEGLNLLMSAHMTRLILNTIGF